MANTLNGEVTKDALAASYSLDKLSTSLIKLGTTVKAFPGLTKVKNSVNKLSEALKTLDFNAVSGVTKVSQALYSIGKVQVPKDFTKAIGAIARNSKNISARASTNIEKLGNALRTLPKGKSLNTIKSLFTAINGVTNATAPTNLNKVLEQLDKIPEYMQKVNSIDTKGFNAFLYRLNALGSALEKLGRGARETVTYLGQLSKTLSKADKETLKLSKSVSTTKTKTSLFKNIINKLTHSFRGLKGVLSGVGVVYLVRELAQVMSWGFKISSKYVETLNFFAVSLGNTADEAKKTIDSWQDLLGLDPRLSMEYWADFNLLLQGFGDNSKEWLDASYTMSQGLTQLVYDLSSIKDVDFQTAFTKLNSAMAGQSRALSRWGIDVSVASLQEYALSKGIQKRVQIMTQAEKAQLRYSLIVEKTSADLMNVQNDLERTLTTPANALRIVKQQLEQVGRALGNFITPLISAALPKIKDFLVGLTYVFNELALIMMELFNYKPEDYISQYEGKFDAITNSAEDAEEAVGGLVSGIDKFNVISTGNDDKKTGQMFEGLNLNPYEFIKNFDKLAGRSATAIKAKIEPILNVVKDIVSTVNQLVKDLGGLRGIMIAIVATVSINTLAKIPILISNITKSIVALGTTKNVIASFNTLFQVSFVVTLMILVEKWDEMGVAGRIALTVLATALGVASFALRVMTLDFSACGKATKAFAQGIGTATTKVATFALTLLRKAVVALVTFTKQLITTVSSGLARLVTSLHITTSALTIFTASLISITAISVGIITFINNFEKMSTWERWLVPLAAAIIGVAVAITALKVAQSGPFAAITAGSIAGGVALATGAILAAKSKFADGGYISAGNMFIAGEKGAEWVGRQGNTSTIVNDRQMSDIMREAVSQGVTNAIGTGNTSNTVPIEVSFTGVNNDLARALAKPMAEQFRKQNIKVRGA